MDRNELNIFISKAQEVLAALVVAVKENPATTVPVPAPTPVPFPAVPAPTPTPTLVRIERQPGIFYFPDPDSTRGDILEGQDTTKLPFVRWVDHGYNVLAWGPLNRRYKGSGWCHAFGSGRNAVFDGANGNMCIPPMPDYSPAGFPLRYTNDGSGGRDGFGNPKGKVIGTATIFHDGHSFSNDAEVLAYIAADDEYQARMARADKEQGNEFSPAPKAPARARANDGLYDSYGSIQQLVDDAKALAFGKAITVDDNGVYPGFEPIVAFKSVGGKITR